MSSLSWDKCVDFAIGLYIGAAGAFACSWGVQRGNPPAMTWQSTALLGAALLFFFGAVAFSILALARHPTLPGSWRRMLLGVKRQRGRRAHQSAKDLEIVVRKYPGDRVALRTVFSLFSFEPSPEGTVLEAGLSEVEIINRYMRPLEVDRLRIGVFDRDTGREIPLAKERSFTVDGDRHIDARSVQRYRVNAVIFFDRLISRTDVEVFIAAEVFGLGCQRTRIDDAFFS